MCTQKFATLLLPRICTSQEAISIHSNVLNVRNFSMSIVRLRRAASNTIFDNWRKESGRKRRVSLAAAGSRLERRALMRAAGSATSGLVHIKIISSLRRPKQKQTPGRGSRRWHLAAHQRMPIIDTRQIFNEEFAGAAPRKETHCCPPAPSPPPKVISGGRAGFLIN